MGKKLIIFCLVLWCVSTFAQYLKPGAIMQIGISYDKTLHFIYSTSIKYFDVGDSNKVAVDKPEDVNNVIRLKSQERNFSGTTNLSVVTSDGVFHSYMLRYEDKPKFSYIREGKTYVEPQKIDVCSENSTHLIYPSKIKYIDFGDNTISVERAGKVDNIIRVQAVDSNFPETNVSVITEDGTFYTLNVDYSKSPGSFSYVIADSSKLNNQKDIAIFNDVEINEVDQNAISNDILKSKRNIYNLAARKGSVNFSVWNVYVMNNTLLMHLQLHNKSSINYDIDFIKYYITDRKTMKKTASQEIVLEPIFQKGFSSIVENKTKMDWIVAFDKFTIPEDRQFVIEIQEKNGGRHFKFNVPAADILDAKIFQKGMINNN